MRAERSSRAIALEVLLRVDGGAPSDRALDRSLRQSRLDERDRRLTTELVYGTLRRQATLDRLLAPHSRRPFDQLDPAVRLALRLAAYQILYLDSVPAHAAVDAAVESVKRHQPAAAGLVNGVLRAWLRSGGAEAIHEEASTAGAKEAGEPEARQPVAALAERFDIPVWWADRWQQAYGAEVAAAWFARTLQPAALVVRPHPRALGGVDLRDALATAGIETSPSEHAGGALRVVSGNPLSTALFREGAFSLRGEASQMVTCLMSALLAPGDRILDACTGRGGKAIQCAEDANDVTVLAADVVPWRVRACSLTARRAGTPEVKGFVADLSRPLPVRDTFDHILLDAPCSGLGTVRRRPEVKWRIEPGDLRRLAALQKRILSRCADALSAGGTLLYVTCSTEPEENEEVVEDVLASRSDLRRVPVRAAAGRDQRLIGEDGYFRTFPHLPDLEGFFAAAIERR